jgi:hypothetical protein
LRADHLHYEIDTRLGSSPPRFRRQGDPPRFWRDQ